MCNYGLFLIFYTSAVVYCMNNIQAGRKLDRRADLKEGNRSPVTYGGSGFSFRELEWFYSLSSWCTVPLPVLLFVPPIYKEGEVFVLSLISWYWSCPQTEPLILLIDSFAASPYSCLHIVFVGVWACSELWSRCFLRLGQRLCHWCGTVIQTLRSLF